MGIHDPYQFRNVLVNIIFWGMIRMYIVVSLLFHCHPKTNAHHCAVVPITYHQRCVSPLLFLHCTFDWPIFNYVVMHSRAKCPHSMKIDVLINYARWENYLFNMQLYLNPVSAFSTPTSWTSTQAPGAKSCFGSCSMYYRVSQINPDNIVNILATKLMVLDKI